MSHVFISYSHDDKKELEVVLHALNEANIPYWFDKGDIEGGEEWRAAIDTAIEESFALVVIVTPNSVASHHVTYEWAYAMGNSIHVLPLLFQDLPSNSKYPLVERKQYDDCLSYQLPEIVITKLKELQRESPLLLLLGQRISDIVLPMRVMTRVSLWSYQYARSGIIDYDEFRTLVDRAKVETIKCYLQELPDFWLTRSSAFNRRQTRLFAELILRMEEIWHLLNDLTFNAQMHSQDHTESISTVHEFLFHVLNPLFDKLRVTWQDYSEFDKYLRDVSDINIPQSKLDNRRFWGLPYYTIALKKLSDGEAANIQRMIEKVEKTHPIE